jgi:16S rRNA processing protein RimM
VDRILVGYVRRAHGIKGAVIVRPLSDEPDQRWIPGAVVTSDAEPPVDYTVVSANAHPAGVLVRFEGVDDRNTAESLKGTSFTIPSDERRDLDDDEYWPDDLVGCTVFDESGATLGTVEAVVFGAAQDRLAVRTAHGTVEVPLVEAIIPTVDVAARRIVATPPPGLFDPE